MESKVGYILSGPTPTTTCQFLISTNSAMMLALMQREFNLEHFWDLESVGVIPFDDILSDNVLDQYTSSCITRDRMEHPLKPDCPDLSSNRLP